MSRKRNPLRVAAFLLACSLTAGCAELNRGLFSAFAPRTDTVAGVMTPRDRLKVLHDKAKNAHILSPTERMEMAQDLATSYQQEESPFMRRATLVTLSHYPGTFYEDTLRIAVRDEDRSVRIEAARLWGEQKNAEAAQRLRTLLETDPEVDVRLAATRALGHVGSREAVDALGVALDQRDPALQGAAMESLVACTGQDLGNDVHRWRQYVRGETPGPPRNVSIAEQLRSIVPF